ncbi:hypothetical protein F441_13182 [Phytophthora nicotianae CJ01A1]|uniref:Uncharacterized protein n=1 Tax=Phytophthora nicotianae CJ01A1 TaxID=1317063 RepID=W2WLR8_PHYNI|nr:hypothetical protein F441_13182 [Phytophthora nicotianae CJ01A1]
MKANVRAPVTFLPNIVLDVVQLAVSTMGTAKTVMKRAIVLKTVTSILVQIEVIPTTEVMVLKNLPHENGLDDGQDESSNGRESTDADNEASSKNTQVIQTNNSFEPTPSEYTLCTKEEVDELLPI